MKEVCNGHTYYGEKISDDPVLIDLGACLGGFASHFRGLHSISTIIMVEPSKSNFSAISLMGNGISKLQNAVSAKTNQVLTFYELSDSEEAGSCFFNHPTGVSYEVTSITLDELVKPFACVDLVKIDVEGAEWEIIDNLTPETLDKIQQMTVEFHDFLDPSLALKSESAVHKLKSHGFNVEAISTDYMWGTKYYDTLFYR